MNKKALMHAHTAYMVAKFNMDNIRLLESLGYDVDVACCFDMQDSALSPAALDEFRKDLADHGNRLIETDSLRRIADIKALMSAYKTLKSEIEENRYDIIHTQSPIGGAICRLAARKARKKYGTKVIYAAHGFHFFEGAPKKNWLLFYPAEKICARFTDLLITINGEDFSNATKRLKAKKTIYIPGAGVDIDKYSLTEAGRNSVRSELGVDDDTTVILSVGELIPRKNHITAMKALASINTDRKWLYIIVGRGKIDEELHASIKELGMEGKIKMLGFRSDIADICAASDVYLFPSFQEGLPVALMEAMSVGLPVVGSRIRGNVDLIKDGEGGFLFDPHSTDDLRAAMEKMLSLSEYDWKSMGQINRDTMVGFSITAVNQCMKDAYEDMTS